MSVTFIFCLFGVVNAFSLPSQVEGVQVQKASDTSVRISWREAQSAEDIIIGYKVYFGTSSVQEAGETYDDEVVVYGGIETTIENLQPGTTYYFAVTAIDSEENESENYSAEAEFLLSASETGTEPLDQNPPEETQPKQEIPCKLLPEKFISCEEYTCQFIHPLTSQGMTRTIEGVVGERCKFIETMPNDQRLECNFPEDMQIPVAQYYQKIVGGQETENILQQAMDNGQCLILGKGDLVPLEKDILQPEEEQTVPFEPQESFGPEKPEEFKSAAPDTTPPIEAMNLSVDSQRIQSDGVAVLSWKKSLDLENDLSDQILYVREGLDAWDSGYSIGKNIETLELDVEKGQNYEFKVVSVDAAGNRSESRVFSFSTKLPQSGPAGMIGVFIALFVLGTLGILSARRRA